ncbi:MAG TPA: hypothetical protein PKD61_30100, partial [Polyangiaceae bacterium]|nr:hypothetical protein [Polyangiaceae bacterium]
MARQTARRSTTSLRKEASWLLIQLGLLDLGEDLQRARRFGPDLTPDEIDRVRSRLTLVPEPGGPAVCFWHHPLAPRNMLQTNEVPAGSLQLTTPVDAPETGSIGFWLDVLCGAQLFGGVRVASRAGGRPSLTDTRASLRQLVNAIERTAPPSNRTKCPHRCAAVLLLVYGHHVSFYRG